MLSNSVMVKDWNWEAKPTEIDVIFNIDTKLAANKFSKYWIVHVVDLNKLNLIVELVSTILIH